MIYDFVRAIIMSLLQWLQGVAAGRGQGADAPSDRRLLGRAGARIHEWLHKDGAGQRVQPDQDGAGSARKDLHQDG